MNFHRTDRSWSEEMMSDSDEEDNESLHKRQKTQHSSKTVNSSVNRPRGGSVRIGSGVTASSKYSTPSSSRERLEEKSIYSQFSKSDKEKAKNLLFDSIKVSCSEALKELLQAGVDIDIKNEDKATPLWMAIEENCPLEMISSVMTSSLIGTRYKQNLAPIHRAAIKGDHRLMLQMINKIRSRAKPLPDIVQGSEEQQIEQVRSQRRESGEGRGSYEVVNKKNKYGWTALHYSADGGCVRVLQALLMEQECDVALTTKLGQTAFHFAARKGHLLCLKLLFAAAQCSQSLNSLPKHDKKGWNIACHASAQDNCEVMEWLLNNMSDYGADITSNNEKGSNAILIACEYQKIEMFKYLFSKSSEFTLTKDDKSLLHIAACHDSVEIVELVLAKDYPVDQQDQNGETALHVAYKWGSTRVWQLLDQNGADDTIENNDGKKPPNLAYQKFKIPKEIAKRGKAAIAKYVADLRKGKAKMPRCKLMILGEAGVGKTSLLSLLTGEPFNPYHNETEGVDTDFVRTSNICSDTWKKKAMEGDEEEYKDVASKQFAQLLPDKEEEPVEQHQKKKANLINPAALKKQVELLINKYTKQPRPPMSPKPKFNKDRTGSHHHLPVQHNPILRPLAMPRPTPLQTTSLVVPNLHPPPSQVVRITPPPKPPSVTAFSVPLSVTRSEPNRTSTPRQPSHTVPTDPDHIVAEAMRRGVKLKKLKSSDTKIELPLKFSSFDFAGQKHYKPMHHCFLTSRAVYVVAFNVRHLLDDQQDQCIHELKFWINSIHIYTNDDAKIVLVGTHRGPYPGLNGNKRLYPLTPEQEKTIDESMTKNFDKDCYVLRVSWLGDKMIAMVESSLTGVGSGANVIRQKLLELGDRYPGNNDDLPTSYLRLEAKIFKERKENNLISRKEVERWAREYGIDDPTVALTFFHDIGSIIDPSKLPPIFVTKDGLSVLQDTILLFPQWLADVMKELMEIERSDPKYNPKSIRQLQQDGIVDEQFLSILWEKQLKESRETFEIISVLLQAYGLIIPVGRQETLQYYIPFQLPSHSAKMKKSTSDCNRIHISFGLDDSFLPPFLLHHVMFKLYTDSDCSKECCFLATEGFIESLNDCQWWVCQKDDDIIEVLIRTSPNVRTILPVMQYLNQSLVTILKELKAVKYTLGPFAKCDSCEKENLLKYISYTDHQSEIANNLKCSSCAYYEKISITTAAVISKVYKVSIKSFLDRIKTFQKDVLKQLERKLKRKYIMDSESTLNDVIEELYEKNEQDPWREVVSVLERLTYDGCDGANDLVEQIKKEQLFMCDHIEQTE